MSINRERWPLPRHNLTDEPKFLLLLTPPNSGSTAIANFVGQLRAVAGLQNRYEGQWLLKGMSDRRRWEPDRKFDWHSVKAVWSVRIEQRRQRRPKIEYIFEKSPPHMVRYKELLKIFNHHGVVINNRNPYASISSKFFRYIDFQKADEERRNDVLVNFAKRWVERGHILKEIAERENYPVLTYEDFCENPLAVLDLFNLSHLKNKIDASHKVKVKDYEDQPIINMNYKQIAKLNDEQIEKIMKILKGNEDILRFFGYYVDIENSHSTSAEENMVG